MPQQICPYLFQSYYFKVVEDTLYVAYEKYLVTFKMWGLVLNSYEDIVQKCKSCLYFSQFRKIVSMAFAHPFCWLLLYCPEVLHHNYKLSALSSVAES